MFVLLTHRGWGYARAVLAELERTAAAAGRRRAVLETGTRQPEAIALYTSAGYLPIARFGVYRDAPNSRCYAKDLPSTA
jgi:GNAT superfamily N-acetyltransferase